MGLALFGVWEAEICGSDLREAAEVDVPDAERLGDGKW